MTETLSRPVPKIGRTGRIAVGVLLALVLLVDPAAASSHCGNDLTNLAATVFATIVGTVPVLAMVMFVYASARAGLQQGKKSDMKERQKDILLYGVGVPAGASVIMGIVSSLLPGSFSVDFSCLQGAL